MRVVAIATERGMGGAYLAPVGLCQYYCLKDGPTWINLGTTILAAAAAVAAIPNRISLGLNQQIQPELSPNVPTVPMTLTLDEYCNMDIFNHVRSSFRLGMVSEVKGTFLDQGLGQNMPVGLTVEGTTQFWQGIAITMGDHFVPANKEIDPYLLLYIHPSLGGFHRNTEFLPLYLNNDFLSEFFNVLMLKTGAGLGLIKSIHGKFTMDLLEENQAIQAEIRFWRERSDAVPIRRQMGLAIAEGDEAGPE